MTTVSKEIFAQLIPIALQAGKAILEIYSTDFGVELKTDKSPLTKADKKANDIIVAGLIKTGLPILSEEGKQIPYTERKNWSSFWMIDPLDGTKEFIKRNGEFTVNIALIENEQAVAGVVYAPVPDILYIGMQKVGAFKINKAKMEFGDEQNAANWEKLMQKLPLSETSKAYRIVASRSHLSEDTEAFIAKKKAEYERIEIVSKGSSLKLCMIAEQSADVYPRFAPTMEWDTAAGHAIINAAGGKVVHSTNTQKELLYNKEDLLNPWFIAEINKA